MSSPPDLYATEEQREKLIKQIGKSEAKIFKKRLACKDYCDKLLDHVQLMRKDLLCLDSNEDAIAIHEELKGITDCMDIFSFGLDQSVMNEPTQINLADWANLCLFRLAIVRRRLSTIKIYIDKTGSAEALYKIEAFLYYAYEFLNTGELDEYEGEMIKDDCFFNISFLLGHSSIADPLRSTAPENEEESEIVEPLKDSDSETESSSDEEMVPVKADDDASDELEVEPDVEPEVHVEGEESELGEGKENSAIGSVEEQVEIKDGETEEEKQDDEKEERDEKEDEKEGEEKETSKEIQESPAVEVSDEKVSGGEKEISNEATKEEDSGKTEEVTDEKTEQSEKKEEKSEEAGGNKKISKKADKKKGNDKTASPDKESSSENKSRRGTTSGTMSPFKLRFGRKKKKDNQRDSVPTAAVLSTPQNPSKKNIKIGRMPRSPLVTKKKEAKKGRSLSAFSRKKIVMEPSLEPPMVSGQIFISAKGSGWKNQWGVLNSEKLEIYKDNECLHLVKTVPIGSFAHLSFVNPEEIAKDEKDEKNEKKKKNISHVIILDYAAGTIHIGTDSRNDLLEWAIGLCCIYRDTSKKNLIPNLNDLLVELYSKSYGDQTAIKREEEQWIFVGGLLTCVGKSIQYSWDGLSLQHLKGDDFGEVTWDGIYLTLKRKDKEDVVFHWVPCAHEFKSPSDPNGSSSIVWNWNKERLLQFLPICPDSEKPKMWKFLRPVAPPVAMSVEMFSLLYEGKEIIPEFDSPIGGSYIRERRNQRTKNKEEGVIEREKKGTKDKKKRKSRKRKSANSEDKISRKNKKKEGEEEKSVTEEKSTVEEKSVEETSGDENSADEKEKEKESNENKPDAPASETEKSAEEDGEQAAEAENAE